MGTLKNNANNIEISSDLNFQKRSINFNNEEIGFIVIKHDSFDFKVVPSINFSKEFNVEIIKHHFENNPFPNKDLSIIERNDYMHEVIEKYVRPILVEYYLGKS